MRTRAEPFAWVREDMLSVMGRNWAGSRFDGRNDGSRARCACSSADGEMRGIVWGGMEVWLFVWEEAVVAIEECSLPVVTSDRTLNRASHLFFGPLRRRAKKSCQTRRQA